MPALARPTATSSRGKGRGTERALARAVRRLVLTWVLCVVSTVALTALAGASAYAVADLVDDRLRLVVLLAVAAAGAALLVRLVPSGPVALGGTVTPSPNLRRRLESWVEEVTGRRIPVRVSEECLVRVDVGGELVVGMPYVAGLTPAELAVLVRGALVRARLEARPGVRLALALTRAGRRTGERRDRLDRALDRVLSGAVAAFEGAYAASLRARWAEDEDHVFVEPRAELVAEAWRHVTEAWLAPGREVGVEHAFPFTGLADFLDACERDGALSTRSARHDEDTTPMLQRDPWSRSERRAAADLFGVAETGRPLVDWEEHPRAVTLRQWRSDVGRGLVAASTATGTAVAASIGALVDAVPETITDQWRDVLVAAAHLHLVESGRAVLAWEWPLGTLLVVGGGGEPIALDVPATVARMTSTQQVLAWLRSLGVDTGATVWLGEAALPTSERSLYAVDARLGRRRVRLVFTDHALRTVPRARSRRSAHAQRLFPTSDPDLEAIDAGRPPRKSESVRWSQVADASLAPVTLGLGWRLRLRTQDGRQVAIRGSHDHRAEEELLRGFLGDRLHVRWSHRQRLARGVRYAVRCIGCALGGVGLLVAGLGALLPPAGATWHDAARLATVSLGVLLIGLVPDALAHLAERRGARRG